MRTTVMVVLVALALPSAAWAQDDEEQKSRARSAAEAEKLRSKALNLAQRSKYEEAYETFLQVLPLVDYPDDQVLFNIGAIAFEALKDCNKAILYFHGYLYAAPADPSAKQVRERLERCLTRVKDTGTLHLEAGEPENVEVRVNDVIVGRTPVPPLKLPPGTYRIDAEMMEHHPHRAEVVVDAALNTRHRVDLKKMIFNGNLKVITEPPGATVYINEVKVGQSPYERKSMPTRKYLVRIEKEGMDRWIRYVTVERDQTVTVNAKLESTGVNVPIPPIPDQ